MPHGYVVSEIIGSSTKSRNTASHLPQLCLQPAKVENPERAALAFDQPLLLQLRHFAAHGFPLGEDQRRQLLLSCKPCDLAGILSGPLAHAQELGREALLG